MTHKQHILRILLMNTLIKLIFIADRAAQTHQLLKLKMRLMVSPMVLAMVTAYACSIGSEQLNSSLTSSSGSRDSEELQDVCVSFTPLTVHTAHWSRGSCVETNTVELLSGRTTICKHSEGSVQSQIATFSQKMMSTICMSNWKLLAVLSCLTANWLLETQYLDLSNNIHLHKNIFYTSSMIFKSRAFKAMKLTFSYAGKAAELWPSGLFSHWNSSTTVG